MEVGYVREWLNTLGEKTRAQVTAALDLLAESGPHLGRPYVDTLTGSRIKNLKELRPGSEGASEIRILFAFDPKRHAIILVGGDKSGQWRKWYKTNIPLAERIFEEHVQQQKEHTSWE